MERGNGTDNQLTALVMRLGAVLDLLGWGVDGKEGDLDREQVP